MTLRRLSSAATRLCNFIVVVPSTSIFRRLHTVIGKFRAAPSRPLVDSAVRDVVELFMHQEQDWRGVPAGHCIHMHSFSLFEVSFLFD